MKLEDIKGCANCEYKSVAEEMWCSDCGYYHYFSFCEFNRHLKAVQVPHDLEEDNEYPEWCPLIEKCVDNKIKE